MSLRKSLLLSLVCFTLDTASVCADCVSMCHAHGIVAVDFADDGNNVCNWPNAIDCVNAASATVIEIRIANTNSLSSTPADFQRSCSVISAVAGGTALSTNGGAHLVRIHRSEVAVTMAPASSLGTITFSGSGGTPVGRVDVERGRLVLGPQFIYPTSTAACQEFHVWNSGVLRLEGSGTCGSPIRVGTDHTGIIEVPAGVSFVSGHELQGSNSDIYIAGYGGSSFECVEIGGGGIDLFLANINFKQRVETAAGGRTFIQSGTDVTFTPLTSMTLNGFRSFIVSGDLSMDVGPGIDLFMGSVLSGGAPSGSGLGGRLLKTGTGNFYISTLVSPNAGTSSSPATLEIGPSGSESILFSGAISLDVNQYNTLVLGPSCVYPASRDDCREIALYSNGFLELTHSGTIGSELFVGFDNSGNIVLAPNVEVFFTDIIHANAGGFGMSTLRFWGNDLNSRFIVTTTDPFQVDIQQLFVGSSTLGLHADIRGNGNAPIVLENGALEFREAGEITLTNDHWMELRHTGYLSALTGVTARMDLLLRETNPDTPGALEKIGDGKVVLLHSNTYTGGTTVSGGILSISNGNQINSSSTSPLLIKNGGTLETSAELSISAPTTVETGGTLRIDGEYGLTFLTDLNLNSGGIIESGANSLISVNGNLTVESGSIGLPSGSSLVVNGNFNGSGSLSLITSAGTSGSLTLNGTSNFAGTLTLNNVIFSTSNTAALNSGINVSLSTGGMLELTNSANNFVVGRLTGVAGSYLVNNASSLTLTVDTANFSIDSNISGIGALDFNLGSVSFSTIVLGGSNTYTGETRIRSGITLKVTSSIGLGNSSTVDLLGGTLFADETLTLASDFRISSASTIQINESKTLSLSGGMSGAGALTVENGTLELYGSSSMTAPLTIDRALVSIDAASQLGSSSSHNLISGGVLTRENLSLGSFVVTGNNNELSAAFSKSLTVAGNISGTGEMVYGGGGTVVLSGTNTYDGDTTLVNGTVQIASETALGNGSEVVFEGEAAAPILHITGDASTDKNLRIDTFGAAFEVDASQTAAFTGRVNVRVAAAPLYKGGAGTLSILPTINSALPQLSLIISEGEMVGNTAFLENSSATLTASTVLHFVHDATGYYYGANDGSTIAGDGALKVSGSDDLYFLVPFNTNFDQLFTGYTGGTTVTGGSLVIAADRVGTGPSTRYVLGTGGVICDGGNLKAVVVDGALENNALISDRNFTLNQTTTFTTDSTNSDGQDYYALWTIAGNITGAGGLIKDGPGMLYLEGANTYAGVTQVQDGALIVTGSMTSASVVSGVLRGIANIGPVTVLPEGSVAPGASIGTLAVTGDVAFGNNTILYTEINETSASLLDVDGSVTFQGVTPSTPEGVTLFILPETGTYDTQMIYTVIDSTGGITGDFAAAKAIESFYMDVTSVNTGTQVVATITPESVSAPNPGSDGRAVEETLNDIIGWNRQNITWTVPPSLVESSPKLTEVFASLLPLNGTNAMNLALDEMHPALFKDLVVSQEAASMQVGKSLVQHITADVNTLDCAKSRGTYSLWMNGMGNALNQKSKWFKGTRQIGYRSTLAGFVTGADYQDDGYYVGALGGYTSSHVRFHNNRGSGDINTGYFGLYFAGVGEAFYTTVAVTGGWSGYNTIRLLNYTGVDEVARGEHGGRELHGMLDTGMNLPVGRFNIRPFDRVDYLTQHEYEYEEKGAGDWNLHVDKNTSIFLRNELGLIFSTCVPFNTGSLTLSPKLSWVREARIKGERYAAAFTDARDFPFTVIGYFPRRSLFSPGLSISGTCLNDALLFSVYYEGEFVSGYSANRYGGEVRYSF